MFVLNLLMCQDLLAPSSPATICYPNLSYINNLYICDSIWEKGPFGGNVNMWVLVKTHAKSTFHAITDYCIIGIYSVSSTFRPSLKLVLLSCESNEDRTVSLPRSFCSCTEYIGNVTQTVYDNIYGYTGKDPDLSVFIAIMNQNSTQEEVPETISAV